MFKINKKYFLDYLVQNYCKFNFKNIHIIAGYKGKKIYQRFNNKIIKSEEVTGPKRKGRKIGISGDTRPDDNLIEFFYDCDLLIFDSTYTDEHKEKAKDNMHSTAREAATLAVKSNVRKIILSHFSARYEDVKLLAKEAMEIHSNVVTAEDLLTIEVPYDQ